jgi:hypothetical protein
MEAVRTIGWDIAKFFFKCTELMRTARGRLPTVEASVRVLAFSRSCRHAWWTSRPAAPRIIGRGSCRHFAIRSACCLPPAGKGLTPIGIASSKTPSGRSGASTIASRQKGLLSPSETWPTLHGGSFLREPTHVPKLQLSANDPLRCASTPCT